MLQLQPVRYKYWNMNFLAILLVVQIFLLTTTTAEMKSEQNGQTFFVSVDGNDENDGTDDDPWRTLQRAADSVGPGDTVFIQPGIYREQVILRQSGTAEAPITFLANDGGTQQGEGSVRLWGSEDSRTLTWHDLNAAECDATIFPAVDTAQYGQIFCADLGAWKEGDEHIVPDLITQVQDGGALSRLTKAREPDLKIETAWKHHEFWWTADGGESPSGGTSSTTLFDATDDTQPGGIEPGNLASLGDLTGGTLFALDNLVGLYNYRREIAGMVPDGCTPGVDCNGIRLSTSQDMSSRNADFDFGAQNGLGNLTKYYVEGMPQLLDQPGEWVYDWRSHTLYVWSDVSPTERHLEIAKRHIGVSFSDPVTIGQSASYITLDGLSIEMINAHYRHPQEEMVRHTMINRDSLDPAKVQGAVTFFNWAPNASSGLTLQNLRITHASNGIQFFQQSDSTVRAKGINILTSELGNIDGQAVRVHAEINGSADRFPAIDGLTLQGNHIYQVGLRPNDVWLDRGVGVYLLTEGIQNLTIRDNTLEDIGHSGILLDGPAPDNQEQTLVLQNNTIRRACQNGADCAAVLAKSMGNPFNIVTLVENVLEDNQGWSYVLNACQPPYEVANATACVEQWWAGGQAGHGYYPDRAGGMVLYRNLIRNNGYAGIYFSTDENRRGDNFIYNNVIEDARYGISMAPAGHFDNLHIKNNIFYENREAAILLNGIQGAMQIDHNYYKNGASNITWWLDGASISGLANASQFEANGLEYTVPIFAEDHSTKAGYYPLNESAIIDSGAEIPDLPRVSEGQFPMSGAQFDIGLWESEGLAPPSGSAPANFILQPLTTTLQVGDLLQVEAHITSAVELFNLQSICTVDPALLVWEDVQFGGFFTQPNIVTNNLDATAGVWQGEISQTDPAVTLSGDGLLATFTLRVVGSGEATISCDPLAFKADGGQTTILPQNGSVAIAEPAIIATNGITGTISYFGRRIHSGVVVQLPDQPEVQMVTDEQGGFNLVDLLDGDYTLKVDAPRYLPSCTSVSLAGGAVVPVPPTTLAGGDSDDSDDIKINDATLIASNLGLSATSDPIMDERADINADGQVNVLDLTIMATHFGKEGCQIWGDAEAVEAAVNQ